MSRGVRITIGAVTAGALLLVALVAGIMAAAASGPGVFDDDLFFGSPDSDAVAEVLDVDDEFGWVSVDVRWTTDDGEVVVTYVDWSADELPEVGDEIEIVYDSADPEYTVHAAADPLAGELTDGDAPDAAEQAEAAEETGSRSGEVAGWVALGALVLVLPTVVVTVVAAVRAPAPAREDAGQGYRGDPFAWPPGPLVQPGPPGAGYAPAGPPPAGPPPAGYVPAGYAPQGPPPHAPGPRPAAGRWPNPS